MFTDWSDVLSSVDISTAQERQIRAWLKAAAEHQAAVDAFVARCAARLGDSSAVRGATRCTQREADQAVARGEAINSLPAVGAALESGKITGPKLSSSVGTTPLYWTSQEGSSMQSGKVLS